MQEQLGKMQNVFERVSKLTCDAETTKGGESQCC